MHFDALECPWRPLWHLQMSVYQGFRSIIPVQFAALNQRITAWKPEVFRSLPGGGQELLRSMDDLVMQIQQESQWPALENAIDSAA